MLRTRVITALLLVAVLLAANAIGAAALLAVAACFLAAGIFEWLRLAGVGRAACLGLAAATGLFAWGAELAGLRPEPQALATLAGAACVAWLLLSLLLARAQLAAAPPPLPRGLVAAAALPLCLIAWCCLVALLRRGPVWTLSVLALVWLADIAAYFSGRAFGRRKLASRISPGKTWAGVWGALAAVLGLAEVLRWSGAASALWSSWLLQAAPLGGLAVLALLVGASIVGDLFESLVKRQAGAKDSGTLLPGHGGVWDRIDALLPVLPLAVLVQDLLEPRSALAWRALLAGAWHG